MAAGAGNDNNIPVRTTGEQLTPDFDTVSNRLQAANITQNDIMRIMQDATETMPGVRDTSGRLIVSGYLAGTMPYTDADLNALRTRLDDPTLDNTELQMLAIWNANGQLSDEQLDGIKDLNPGDKLDFYIQNMGTWLDNPDASGKATLTANLGVQSILGGEFRDGRTLDILNVQSLDVLMGEPGDNHVNVFYDRSMGDGRAVAAMDDILANMHDGGVIDDDRYLDAAEAWDGKTMTMLAAGNNTIEMTGAYYAMAARFRQQYPNTTPEDVLKAYCDKQEPKWDYEQMMQDIADPTRVWGDNKNAYRSLLVNGEWPDDIDEQTRDAFNLKMAESVVTDDPDLSVEENAQRAHDLMYEAMTAGIAAFRGVLNKSPLGQKLLAICNNFVHSPPINGTMFQEIWDLDDGGTYSDERVPTPTPAPTPVIEQSSMPVVEQSSTPVVTEESSTPGPGSSESMPGDSVSEPGPGESSLEPDPGSSDPVSEAPPPPSSRPPYVPPYDPPPPIISVPPVSSAAPYSSNPPIGESSSPPINSSEPPDSSTPVDNSSNPPDSSNPVDNSSNPPDSSNPVDNSSNPPDSSNPVDNSSNPPDSSNPVDNSSNPPDSSTPAGDSYDPSTLPASSAIDISYDPSTPLPQESIPIEFSYDPSTLPASSAIDFSYDVSTPLPQESIPIEFSYDPSTLPASSAIDFSYDVSTPLPQESIPIEFSYDPSTLPASSAIDVSYDVSTPLPQESIPIEFSYDPSTPLPQESIPIEFSYDPSTLPASSAIDVSYDVSTPLPQESIPIEFSYDPSTPLPQESIPIEFSYDPSTLPASSAIDVSYDVSTPLPQDSIPIEFSYDPSTPLPQDSIPIEFSYDPSTPLPQDSIPIEFSYDPSTPLPQDSIPIEFSYDTSTPLPQESIPIDFSYDTSTPLPDDSIPVTVPDSSTPGSTGKDGDIDDGHTSGGNKRGQKGGDSTTPVGMDPNGVTPVALAEDGVVTGEHHNVTPPVNVVQAAVGAVNGYLPQVPTGDGKAVTQHEDLDEEENDGTTTLLGSVSDATDAFEEAGHTLHDAGHAIQSGGKALIDNYVAEHGPVITAADKDKTTTTTPSATDDDAPTIASNDVVVPGDDFEFA